MTPPIVMLAAMGVMYAAGVYLMLDRSLTRVLLGFMLVGNATNVLLLLAGGSPGSAPLVEGDDLSTEGMLDPLPQALILTAIVITFSITAFLLAMIYRSWRFVRDESLQDDLEDIRLALAPGTAASSEAGTSGEYDDTEFGDEATDPVEEHPLDLDRDSTPAARAAAVSEAATAAGGPEDEAGEAVPEAASAVGAGPSLPEESKRMPASAGPEAGEDGELGASSAEDPAGADEEPHGGRDDQEGGRA
ncbi:Na(+)/H(+) antiporter subunit C [Brevibacterium album]|uniref:Na(+)/H(+) antiporter subunit C n=1 Tax=Brevibacterium album TaxID=417948 RepID=UPI00041BA4DE|nr:Na(+)/H(+) antiporter subunit C [Brevibacterium album]